MNKYDDSSSRKEKESESHEKNPKRKEECYSDECYWFPNDYRIIYRNSNPR